MRENSPRPLWRLIRSELPVWLACLAEVALFVPFFMALIPWVRSWPPWLFAALVTSLMLIPYNLIRVMTLRSISLTAQRRVLLGLLLLALFLALWTLLVEPAGPGYPAGVGELIPPLSAAGFRFWGWAAAIIGLILFGWWRGIALINRPASVERVGLQFRLRALLFAPLIIALASSRLTFDMTPFLLLFGFAQLMGLTLARADDVQRQATGRAFAVQPRWVLTIAAAAAVVVGGSGLAGYLVGQPAVSNPAQMAFIFSLVAVIYALLYLLAPILIPLLDWLTGILLLILRPLYEALGNLDVAAMPLEEFPPAPTEAAGGTVVDQFLAALPAVIFLVLLVGLIWLIITFYGRIVPPREEEKEGQVLGRRPAAGGRPPRSLLERFFARLPDWGGRRAARSIRRVYRQMAFAAASRGFPRERAQTPYEYLGRLDRVWPAGRRETRLITNAYVRIRYGQLPESAAELGEILGAWQTLERQLFERENNPESGDDIGPIPLSE